MKKHYAYHIVSSRVGTDGGRMLYKLRHVHSKGTVEKWVGINQLARYYQQGRLVGKIPNIVLDRLRVSRPKEQKIRIDKGTKKKKLEVVEEKVARDLSGWGISPNKEPIEKKVKMYTIFNGE